MGKLFLAAVIAVFSAGALRAAPPEIGTTFSLRLRGESFDTPARTAGTDRTYELGLVRARFGLDAAWTHWKLHGMLQGSGLLAGPETGNVFGPGATYFTANDGDTSLGVIGIAELTATYERDRLRLVLGRQPYGDGFEVPTGVAHLDGIKRRRLGDRLVGVFDWVNVGRRFDGLSFGYNGAGAHLAGFGFQPTVGGFDHENAFELLDDVTVYGLTLTGKHGAWIPGAEVRVFGIQYEDDRRVAPVGGLGVTTAGASLLAGSAKGNVLLWGAVQTGDWGGADQEGWAFLVDAGRVFDAVPGRPAVHLAWEQSSGDEPGGDRETFFNVIPTNHKYYDLMDFTAFSNLRDAYVETLFPAGSRVKVRVALHDFALTEETDGWYGGSGAFEEESFGYAARLPPGGRFPSRDLGRELNTDVTWTLPAGLQLGIGGGYFWGGEAAEALLPAEEDGRWVYLEMSWTR
jgi:hypothetical protein